MHETSDFIIEGFSIKDNKILPNSCGLNSEFNHSPMLWPLPSCPSASTGRAPDAHLGLTCAPLLWHMLWLQPPSSSVEQVQHLESKNYHLPTAYVGITQPLSASQGPEIKLKEQ